VFEDFTITTSGAAIHGMKGGSGPPVLLLHGIPETHLMWHKVAPALAEGFTVVATDLRGYGASGKPPSTPDHAPYRMRALAQDQVEVMAALGFDRFAVAVARMYDPLAIWRAWAPDVRGAAVKAGHFLPEEAPEETLRHLLELLSHRPR
jgi:pimeloyl-ACP methyl ester carboxylesterase